jgi:hypothetical protein
VLWVWQQSDAAAVLERGCRMDAVMMMAIGAGAMPRWLTGGPEVTHFSASVFAEFVRSA